MKLALGLVLLVGWLAEPAAAERLAVVEKRDGRVAIVDVPRGEVVARYAVGDGPHEVVATPDGRRLFVANYGNHVTDLGRTLHVVDLPSGATRVVDLRPYVNPHGLALSADGGRVFVTVQYPGPEAILELDVATATIRRIHRVDQRMTHMVEPSPDGRSLLTTAITAGVLSIVDRRNGLRRTVATGAGAADVAISADGRFAWVPNEDADSVSIVDVMAGRVLRTLPSRGRRPVRVALTPDGREAWVSLFGESRLVVYDVAGPAIVASVSLPEAPAEGAIGLVLSPDGRRAYVAQMNSDRVHVIDVARRRVVDTIPMGGGPDGMAWLP